MIKKPSVKKPSVKKLASVFSEPKKARAIFDMSRKELIDTDAGFSRFRECFNAPKTYDLRLHVLNACGGFHGLESIETTKGGEYAEYLNAGDVYAQTVIYWRGAYRVQSLGDFVETMERQGVYFV